MPDNAASLLRTYLPLGLVLAAGLVAWGATTANLAANEQNDTRVEQRVTAVERTAAQVQADIAAIKASQEAQKQQLSRVELKLDRLLERPAQ